MLHPWDIDVCQRTSSARQTIAAGKALLRRYGRTCPCHKRHLGSNQRKKGHLDGLPGMRFILGVDFLLEPATFSPFLPKVSTITAWDNV